MATAFDGAGLGMFGSEKRFMSQGLTNADGTPTTAGLILGGLLGKSTKEKPVKLPPFSIGTLPSEQNLNPVPPPAQASAEPMPPSMPNAAVPDNAGESEDHPETQKALEDLGLTKPVIPQTNVTGAPLTSVTPDLLKPRNPAQDQLAGEMAIAPPQQMNLPQYGHQSGGGGMNALSALSSLATLFG